MEAISRTTQKKKTLPCEHVSWADGPRSADRREFVNRRFPCLGTRSHRGGPPRRTPRSNSLTRAGKGWGAGGGKAGGGMMPLQQWKLTMDGFEKNGES